jgi:hypothetical protein
VLGLATGLYLTKGDNMTVLQLILLATHGLVGLIMYKTGFNDGQVEGRIDEFQRING